MTGSVRGPPHPELPMGSRRLTRRVVVQRASVELGGVDHVVHRAGEVTKLLRRSRSDRVRVCHVGIERERTTRIGNTPCQVTKLASTPSPDGIANADSALYGSLVLRHRAPRSAP